MSMEKTNGLQAASPYLEGQLQTQTHNVEMPRMHSNMGVVHLGTAGRATAHVPLGRRCAQTLPAKAIACAREMRLPSFKVNASWMKEANLSGVLIK